MTLQEPAPLPSDENLLLVLDDLMTLSEYVTRNPPVFLRYSEGPRADAASSSSWDYEADVQLPGLSATTLNPEQWWPRPAHEWVARRIHKYADLARDPRRFPWIFKGTVVGRGPDHEPLIADVVPIAELGEPLLREAAAVYRSRFHPGRTSLDE